MSMYAVRMVNLPDSIKLSVMNPDGISRDPRIPASIVLAGLGREFLSECREQSASFTAGRGSEDLHQIRVRLRRMESLLRFSEQAGHLPPVTDLRRRTNSIRNIDVLLEREADFRGMIGIREKACFSRTFEELRLRRSRLADEAVVLLAESALTRRFSRLDQVLAAVSDEGSEDAGERLMIGTHVRQVLKKAEKKFRNLAGRIGEGSSDEEFHQLRIRAKRMRYNAEFLGPWNTEVDTGAIGRYARDLQSLLGEFTDLCFQESAFRNLRDDSAVGCRLPGVLDCITRRKERLRLEVIGVLSAGN